MKIYLDTANIEHIREAAAMGVLDGVTTNPSLVAKEKREFKSAIREICEIVHGPVSAEVVSTATADMVAEGRDLAKIHPNVVVKIPLIPAGIKAVKTLSGEGIRVNVTLCFSAVQSLLAAKAGASFISPFVGRLDDRGHEGMALVRQIRTIYDNYGFQTEVLAASLRHPLHVLDAAVAGADIGTMPYDVFTKLFQHPLTDLGLEAFLNDWKKMQTSK
jgi:transaldolase